MNQEFFSTAQSVEAQFNSETSSNVRQRVLVQIQAFLTTQSTGATVPDQETIARHIEQSSRTAPDKTKITLQTFWWGFHIAVPELPLTEILGAGDKVEAFLKLAGDIPIIGSYVKIVASVFELIETLIKDADKHKHGVYISMLWFVPGVFVPTGIA